MAIPMGWGQMASGQNSFYLLHLVSFSVSEIVVSGNVPLPPIKLKN